MTDCERVLTVLREYPGEFVSALYQRTGVMVHSRVAELRRRGYVIECKRFGHGDYRYRLVGKPEGAGDDERQRKPLARSAR